MRAQEALRLHNLRQEQENGNTNENGTKRESSLEINVESPEPFIGMAKVKYLTSKEIAQLAASLFKQIYADFYGSKVDIDTTNGQPTLTLYFSHLQYDENDVTAFSPKADVAGSNELTRRLANQRINATEGRSSYMMTRYGKDGLAKFIAAKFTDKGRNPQWNQISSDVNNGDGRGFNNTMILSQLRGIDISSLFTTIYGSVDDTGEEVDYLVEIKNSLPTGEFLFALTQINKSELDRSIRAAGITNTNSLGIYL